MSFEKFKDYHNANYYDGDSTFDERHYKKSNGDDFDSCFVQDCYDHFEAGASSQQAKIDELQKRIKKAEKLMRLFFKEDSYEYAISAHDELKGNQND